MLSKKPFSKLTYQEKFDRLFWRGYTREQAEKKLQYPYRAVILPKIIYDYWQRAKQNEDGLRDVWQELRLTEIRYNCIIKVDGFGEIINRDESILRAIADRILGEDFRYEVVIMPYSGKPIDIYITEYHGVYV